MWDDVRTDAVRPETGRQSAQNIRSTRADADHRAWRYADADCKGREIIADRWRNIAADRDQITEAVSCLKSFIFFGMKPAPVLINILETPKFRLIFAVRT